MDRTEASIAPARGGDRTDRGHRCRARAGRILTVTWSWPRRPSRGRGRTAPGRRGGPIAADGPSGPGLSLLAPPTIAGPRSPFAVRLGVSRRVRPGPPSASRVTVYSHARHPTEFDETLSGTAVGIASSPVPLPLAVSSLPADPPNTAVST